MKPQESQKENDNLILKLRALWFLEKVARHESITKKDSQMLLEIFQTIAELFASSNDFVLNYQYLKTIHKYIKQINLKEAYPETYK